MSEHTELPELAKDLCTAAELWHLVSVAQSEHAHANQIRGTCNTDTKLPSGGWTYVAMYYQLQSNTHPNLFSPVYRHALYRTQSTIMHVIHPLPITSNCSNRSLGPFNVRCFAPFSSRHSRPLRLCRLSSGNAVQILQRLLPEGCNRLVLCNLGV